MNPNLNTNPSPIHQI